MPDFNETWYCASMWKKKEKRKSKKLCVIFKTQFYLLMNTEVLDQNGDVYFMLKNKSFFVYTKRLRFFNKSFQEKKKKDSSCELYRWSCLHWSNSPEEYLTESWIDFLIIFFVARFERNLILHVNMKKNNGEKKVEEIIVHTLLNTILFIHEHGSLRSKWRCVFYA